MAFLSMHMGSGPGVAGLSGIHVNSLVPLRSVRILPWASIVTMVAFLATPAGAALMALFIRSASLGAGFLSSAFATRHRASIAQATPLTITLFFINYLPQKKPISPIRAKSVSLRSPGHAATQHRNQSMGRTTIIKSQPTDRYLDGDQDKVSAARGRSVWWGDHPCPPLCT